MITTSTKTRDPRPSGSTIRARLFGRRDRSGDPNAKVNSPVDNEEELEEKSEPYEPDELAQKILNMIRSRKSVRLSSLVEEASAAFAAKPEEVARRIYELSSAGMVTVMDPDPPCSVVRFMKEPAYSAWYWTLLALVAVTVGLVVTSPDVPLIYMRYVLGSLFVLYLPGAALIELLYPKKSDLSQLERAALSLGLSLALVPLVGLVLNYTPLEIRLEPIMASVSLLTVGLATGAVVRKYSYAVLASAGARSATGTGTRTSTRKTRSRREGTPKR